MHRIFFILKILIFLLWLLKSLLYLLKKTIYMDAEINAIFNSIENKDKSNSWKLDRVREVLKELRMLSYHSGFKNGFKKGIEILQNQDLDKFL